MSVLHEIGAQGELVAAGRRNDRVGARDLVLAEGSGDRNKLAGYERRGPLRRFEFEVPGQRSDLARLDEAGFHGCVSNALRTRMPLSSGAPSSGAATRIVMLCSCERASTSLGRSRCRWM